MSLAQKLENYTPTEQDKAWLRDVVTKQPNRQGMANYLNRAIIAQEPWKVRQILDLGGRLDIQTNLPMFSVAMEHGYDEVIERGLEDGLDPNICGLYQSAVYYNRLELFKKIEATGADFEFEKDECLSISTRNGHTCMTRYLLDEYSFGDFALNMALGEAAANGRNQNADLLYDAGADPSDHATDASVIDPMIYAVNNQHEHMVDWLNKKRGRAETYDLEATYFNNQSILGLQMKSNGQYDENGFVMAAKSGHFATLLDRLQDKISEITVKDLKSQDQYGNHVIEILAERGEIKSLLRPTMWRGRLPELEKLVNTYLTPRYQNQINMAQEFIQQQVTQEHIQKQRGRISLKRRR